MANKMFDTERFICEIESQPPLYDVKSKEYSNRDIKAKCWLKVAEAMFEDWGALEVKTKDEKVKELMKKWKAIRDCFVRDHRSITATGTGQAASKKKKYIYYDQLLFLLPNVKGNSHTGSNIAPTETNESVEDETQIEEVLNVDTNDDTTAVGTTNVSSPPPSGENLSAPTPKRTKRKNVTEINPPLGKKATFEKNILSSSKELNNILASTLEWQKSEQKSDANGHKAFLLSFAPVLDSMPLGDSMLLRGKISQLFSEYFAQSWSRTGTEMSSSTATSRPSTSAGLTSDESLDYNISDYLNL